MGAETDFDVLEQLDGDDADETLDGLLEGTELGDEPNDPEGPPLDLIEQLRATGADEALLEQVRDGTMLKADHTRKTQALANERRQLDQQTQLNDLQRRYGGVTPAVQQPAEDPLDAALKRLDPDDENPEAQTKMRELLDANREKARREYRAEIAPVLQRQQTDQANAWLANQKASFVSTFGQKATDARWPEVVSEMTQHVQMGQQVPSGVSIYLDKRPDEAMAVAGQIRKTKQKKQRTKAGAGTLEGFQKVQRTRTPSGGGDRKIPKPTDDETAMRIYARVTQRQPGG